MVDLLIIVGTYMFLSSILWASKVTEENVTAVLIRMVIGSLLMFSGLYFGDYSLLVQFIADMGAR